MALSRTDTRPVEIIPVQQNHHQEQRPEQEAVAAGHAECPRRTAAPDDVAGARHQPVHDRRQLAEQPLGRRLPGLAHRTEQVTPHGGRDQAGRHITPAPGEQRDGGAPLGVAGGHVQAQGDQAADDRHDAAGGRRHRVRHHQFVLGDHMRQRRRQRGQEEPVHAQHQQDRDVERRAVAARGHQRRRQHHEGRPEQGRPDQDLAPRPPVDKHAGERPDQRVRHVKGRECGGPGGRVRERRGIEEHVRADPGGDDAVAGLRDQPGGEQPPEVSLGQDDAQVTEERRAPSYNAPSVRLAVHPSSLGPGPHRDTA